MYVFTSVEGVRLWSHERGRGEDVLILLPPGPGVDGSVFHPWFAPLEDACRLVALDLPGHGRSDPGDTDHWSFASLAATVVGFARARRFARFAVLGHSFGSFVALTVAADHPGAATAVVASCGACYDGDLGGLGGRLETLEPPALRASVTAAFEAEEHAETPDQCRDIWLAQAPFFCADPTGPAVDRLRDSLRTAVYTVPPIHHDWGDLDLRDALARSPTPLLAIAGASDRSIVPAATRRVADVAADGRYVELTGAAHFPFVETPEPYFAAIGDFLAVGVRPATEPA
jgi:3-oxoadipate enol-lactonase